MIANDTICAVSTAPGTGGIAVIRISGKEAISITDMIYRPRKKEASICSQAAYTLGYGHIEDETNRIIDDVIVALFRGPHSFTGEDVVEISCHGSIYIQQQIIALLIRKGCRAALPGEFTQRAFENGKMDLSQAEAVADLIASSSEASHRLAINQTRGGFSRELARLRTKLLDFVSLVELELDFSEEEVEFANREQLKEMTVQMEQVIHRLAESFSVGNVIKNGLPVAIIGETNVGKSTLLNRLLHEDRALVSDIHGTTRDVIEDTFNLQGVTFRFIDTAGIRETQDTIESMGIERTFQKLKQAAIVLWVIDATRPIREIEELSYRILPMCENKKLILVFNKIDCLIKIEKEEKEKFASTLSGTEYIFISAKENEYLSALEKRLVQAAQIPQNQENDVIVSNIRHYEALTRAHTAILRVLQGLETGISGDFLSQDIRECMHYLGEITGQITSDDILQTIFSRFCIGK